MSMSFRNIVLAAVALVPSAVIVAQPADSLLQEEKEHHFTLGGSLMTRGEMRDGGLSYSEEDGARFIIGRSRLSLNYRQPNLEMQFTPQHVGVWGTKGDGSINMREAWLKLDKNGFFAKVGRQSLAYDDERIIGLDEWSMTSAYHDVLKLGYEGHGHQAHAILAYNQNNSNVADGGTKYVDGGQVYKDMQTLWYHYDFNRRLGASLLFMNTGLQSKFKNENVTEYQQLAGTYIKYAPGPLTLETSFYYQMGHDEMRVPIHAWMVSAEANWKINDRWKANTGYFRLSGDEDFTVPEVGDIGMMQHTKTHSFSLLYASHHEFYGAMDFFYLSAYYGGYSPGLQDFHVGGTLKTTDWLNLEAKYHYLSTSVKVMDEGYTLGHELELTASMRIMKDAWLMAGYTVMFGTETMKRLKRRDDMNQMNWGWLMFVVSPKFFSLDW